MICCHLSIFIDIIGIFEMPILSIYIDKWKNVSINLSIKIDISFIDKKFIDKIAINLSIIFADFWR